MSLNIFKALFGSRNDRILKKYNARIAAVSALEAEYETLSDDALREKTEEFKQQFIDGRSLDDMLVEAFAVCREGSKRALSMRHYDVQVMGAIALHEGNIAEMRTGEGKTLVATLTVYLNALSGKGVHVITVNDYLAKRDGEWMGRLYGFLGLTTGVIASGMAGSEKQAAYASDITYGTNNEFGFDYLRDNMAIYAEERVMRGQNFAVIDEVDSILIDEARTPLIISGPAENHADLYNRINPMTQGLERGEEDLEEKTTTGDYVVNEKHKKVDLTDEGYEKFEEMLIEEGLLKEGDSLYAVENINLVKHVNAALRATVLFERNTDYVVEDGEIVIVDEFTGRKMNGRRWGNGLHQAVEAKEGVEVQSESQTYASITFQNYFRQYGRLSGMTGTADTEASEFLSTYGLEVVVVPSNIAPKRNDLADLVFLEEDGKFKSLVRDIQAIHATKQPILVGTASIEKSESISALLTQENIVHNVLNAKHHEKEAHIIESAGLPGAITVATNMAGRGTDIVLGGSYQAEIEKLTNPSAEEIASVKAAWQITHDEVIAAGGLMVLGSERHESRRIDNQLRGRSGRQGDVGTTRFYLSLDDELMRRFASENVKKMMRKLGMQSDEPIEHGMVSKSIARAQKQVERMHQDERANLLKFDNIANEQRKVVYQQRNELMDSDETADVITSIRDSILTPFMGQFIPVGSLHEQWDIAGLEKALIEEFSLTMDVRVWLEEDKDLHEETVIKKLLAEASQSYAEKMSAIDEKTLHHFEKEVLLKTIDQLWREHLMAMEYLQTWIGLKGYAQQDPFQQYRLESSKMFQEFLDNVMFETTQTLLRVQIQGTEEVEAYEQAQRDAHENALLEAKHSEAGTESDDDAESDEQSTFKREEEKVGRNDPCPCGSGKKYKKCCGALT